MKRLLIFLLPFFVSCVNHPKFQEISRLPVPPMRGNIASVLLIREHYMDKNKPEVLTYKDSCLLIYEGKDIIREELYIKKNSYTTTNTYNEDHLPLSVHIQDHKNNQTTRFEYFYDDAKNVILMRSYDDNVLAIERKSTYDIYGNKTSENMVNHSAGENGATSYEIDYKKRTVLSKSAIDEGETSNGYFLRYYNKKGLCIKTQGFKAGVLKSESKCVYDRHGNLINERTIKTKSVYKNFYDSKKNLILKEQYYNGRLIERTRNHITYK